MSISSDYARITVALQVLHNSQSNVLLLSAMVVGNAGDLAPGGENRQQHDKTSGL